MASGGSLGKGRKPIARGGQGGRAAKAGSHRKGAATGSGGHGKEKLKGKGPTPPAELRPGHPAARRAAAAAKRTGGAARTAGEPRRAAPRPVRSRPGQETDEYVAGRNSVVEALRAGVPARALLVAPGVDHDDRIDEALETAGRQRIPVREATRSELDRVTGRALHQGLALVVPPYEYAHPDDVLRRAAAGADPALVVALDGVTDPRNLGAVVRSAAAFGAHGVVVPERRAAGITAAAWKASAGAAARLPVARAGNLARTLSAYADAGLLVVGLAADGALSLDDFEAAREPLCVVVGSEGRGLGRLVAARCDLLVGIPVAAGTESLNAGIAAAVALAEVARRRRTAPP